MPAGNSSYNFDFVGMNTNVETFNLCVNSHWNSMRHGTVVLSCRISGGIE